MYVITDSISITDHILLEKDSTTLFIESISGKELKVKFLKQLCRPDGILERKVLLYQEPSRPIYYAESFLMMNVLTDKEMELLIRESIPIGKIFYRGENIESLQKRNINVELDFRTDLFELLEIQDYMLLKKSYDCWSSSRYLGCINEYFSEKSLERMFE
jgi:chorismate-pyruvate lyase